VGLLGGDARVADKELHQEAMARRRVSASRPSQMCGTSGGQRGLGGWLVSSKASVVDEDMHQAVRL
jgi:hypothetical protein